MCVCVCGGRYEFIPPKMVKGCVEYLDRHGEEFEDAITTGGSAADLSKVCQRALVLQRSRHHSSLPSLPLRPPSLTVGVAATPRLRTRRWAAVDVAGIALSPAHYAVATGTW
jgi:hypothetical protein